MIPLKLHIKNFLSYSTPQDIDFEPYSLICLSGKNGHGKSSLLDALTWALWGQARKTSGTAKADEGLVHLGESNMVVILDFICNRLNYRVKREFTLSAKKGHTNLEFGILEKESGAFKPLTDKTIRATQNTIIRTIGLDYDGFINSAFIKQGQSDEFSKKSPKERKDLLASLLGLEKYEQLRKLAQDIVKEAQIAHDQTYHILKNLEQELTEKKHIEELLQQSDASLSKYMEAEKALRAEYVQHASDLAQAQKKKLEAEKIVFQHDHLAKRIEEELATIRSQTTLWRDTLRKQRNVGNLDTVEQKKNSLQKELRALQMLGAKKLELKEQVLVKQEALRTYIQSLHEKHLILVAQIDREKDVATYELKTTQKKLAEITDKIASKVQQMRSLEIERTRLQQTIHPIDDKIIEIDEKQLERRKSFYHSFASRAQSLKSTIAGILQKKHLINCSEQATCPLCEQHADKDQLTRKLAKEETLRAHQLNRLTHVCSSLKGQLLEQHAQLEELKKNREKQHLITMQLLEITKQLEKERNEGEILKNDLKKSQELIAHLSKAVEVHELKRTMVIDEYQLFIAEDSTIRVLQGDLSRLNNELDHIQYNPEQEKKIASDLAALDEKSREYAALFKALALQSERKRSIHEKCNQTRILQQELSQLKPTVSLTDTTDELSRKENFLRDSLEAIAKEKEIYIHQKGSLENQMQSFDQKEQAVVNHAKNLKEYAQRVEEYTAIAAAFSKDGIQALLIEEALPEIEQEANLLLSRLTENQAHISIDSLRDTKSGKTKETLDIKISDAKGIRPYEMFSGGEAFRIDFALRIALSKLLARRAGTALQTLIIDEGFGSQDEEGLGYIMQAIHMILTDFEKILIISHLPALKEQFPVHFEVLKTSQGSIVSVVEHC